MSKIDYRASENDVDQIPLRRIVKGLLSVILWLHNNPGVTVSRQKLFSRFKERMRQGS